MTRGRVKWFSDEKGFGFIEFEVVEGRRDKEQASKVEVVG